MSVHLKPEEIEAESFRIIDAEAGSHPWPAGVWPLVRRVVHTSADFDYVSSMIISPGAVAAGIGALTEGCGVVTDTTMALSGINKRHLSSFGGRVSCFVADPEVAKEAASKGITRSIVAMRKGAADPANTLFVIGNAPTALFELLRLCREGLRPRLIVGLPVGFVGAAESKDELVRTATELGVPFITNRGRKGGSNVAAAVVNALMILAGEGKG